MNVGIHERNVSDLLKKIGFLGGVVGGLVNSLYMSLFTRIPSW